MPTLVRAMRLTFWGSLLLFIDLHISTATNGYGFTFDIFNDALGMILILLALWSLAGVAASAFGTPNAFTWLTLISVVNLVVAVQAHWIRPPIEGLRVLSSIWGIIVFLAFLVFCHQMQRLTAMLLLSDSARSWKTTELLVACLLIFPAAIINVLPMALGLTGSSFSSQGPLAGAIAAFCLALCIGALVHFLVSVWRTSSEAFRRG